jgi:hypothetical protein
MLGDPARYQAIQDRVEIAFAPHNPVHLRAGDSVSLDVDVKNVPVLLLKVFEINTLNVFLSQGRDVDTALDLDGLVAAEERRLEFKEPPSRRVRRRIDLPSLSKPGVYVVELIGGGISSRALVRKGRLHCIEKPGPAGHQVRVLDESFRPLRDASVWMGGREYPADKDGEILLPYSERPGRTALLLRHGTCTTLERFDHLGEAYTFTAGFYVDRESLLRGAEAKLLVRPSLRLNGVPLDLRLLGEPVLVIRSTDRQGVESGRELRGLEWGDLAETVVPFQVPDDLARIAFELRGKVESLIPGRKIDVSDSRAFDLNGIDAEAATEDLHLSRNESGYVLHALGKGGEPRASRPVSLTLRHRLAAHERSFDLQTDGQGRVELGVLDGVVRIAAALPSGVSRTWTPPRDRVQYPRLLQVKTGEAFALPWTGGTATRSAAALLERAAGGYRADRFEVLSAKDGELRIAGLPAGDYELFLKDEGVSIPIRVTGGSPVPARLLEPSPEGRARIARAQIGRGELRVQIGGVTGATRVHVFGVRFLPGHSAFHELGREGLPVPRSAGIAAAVSVYVSGRDIGDEYRYILERRQSAPRPGLMLARPGLLLNPWAVRATGTGTADARDGRLYEAAPEASAGAPAPCAPPPGEAGEESPGGASLDCLARPSVVMENLEVGEDGTLSIPKDRFAGCTLIRVVAVDPSGVSSRDVLLPDAPLQTRDLRLRLALDPARHYTERKEVAILDAGETLEIADLATARVETYDTIGRVFGLYRTLSGLATLDAFAFLCRWPSLSDEEKRSRYSEFACHELHVFLARKDPDFFKTVVQPYLKNKKDKTFIDHYLVGSGLEAYRRPWDFGRLNVVERILLGRKIADERDPVGRHVADQADLIPRDPAEDARRFDTALKGKALETGDALGFGAASKAALGRLEEESSRALPASMAADRAKEEVADEEAPKKKAMRSGRGPERRRAVKPLYRTLDQTQEYAESNYYRLPIAEQGPELVTANRFWRDYAKHEGKGPFLSAHLAEPCRNLTEALLALAVLDLPFEAKTPATKIDGSRASLCPSSPLAVFHRQIRAAEPAAEKVPVLVSQNYLRDDDRTRELDGESVDKYVSGEFLTHVVYVCQVVLTNPGSSRHTLELLLQIPAGSIPAKGGFTTRGIPVRLEGFATETIEYAFYFPAAGTFDHYPAHVSKDEALVATATPWPLKVVERPTTADPDSWEHVSQHADAKTTLKFLKERNVERLDLSRIAWRMKDKAFYGQALDLLASRHAWDDTLWSYAIHHRDPERVRDYVLNHPDWLQGAGLRLDSEPVEIDPVAHRWYEHLEYAPLVNARAHRLGATRRILNDRFAEQYRKFLRTLTYRAEPGPDDLLAAATAMFLQDRVDEGLALFDRVKREAVETRIQWDYLKVTADFLRERSQAARATAEKYRDHPVDRWRNLFRNALAQLDEIEGAAAKASDAADRDQEQSRRAAEAATFDLGVEDRTVTLTYRNLKSVTLNYYPMDLELLFSRQPFVQEQSERFAFIMPTRSDEIALPAKATSHAVALPKEFRGSNVVVEAVAEGRRASRPCFAHELDVQITEAYGQLRVVDRATRAPLPKVYVKVFARGGDGTVRFMKDGYTDLRGRFDYTSLSTDDLDRAERFAILVLSGDKGAVVKEAAPPKR